MKLTNDKLKMNETWFVNNFYPFKDQTEIRVVFQPSKIINSAKLIAYAESKGCLTKEQVELLNNVFGSQPTIKGKFTRNKTDLLKNIFSINLKVSTTGKEEDNKLFYCVNQSGRDLLPVGQFYNFIFHSEGNFYGISASNFVSRLKNVSKETDTKDSTLTSDLIKILNTEEKVNYGFDILKKEKFKCGALSIAKVLISLFPNLNMQRITELCDYIKSEMIVEASKNVIDKDIIELKGDLITYFYNHKNYFADGGSLGNSCMRYDNATELIRFYANNPTSISMLVLVKNKKICARTILWKSVKGEVFCDRFYSNDTKYETRIVGYCKKKEYKTIYSSNEGTYGMTYSTDCVVQLDKFEIKGSYYPYFDSMYTLDLINKLIAVNSTVLTDYLIKNKKDYIVKDVYRAGANGGSTSMGNVSLSKNGNNNILYVLDSEHRNIGSLSSSTIITKPKLKIINRNNLIVINQNDKVELKWCADTLIKKYNSLRPTLVLQEIKNKSYYVIKYYDKKFTIYSSYHKMHILISQSIYVNKINSYVIKNIVTTTEFKNYLHLASLRKLFGGKLVKIKEEYLTDLKEQLSLLPLKISLMDIRKSRVYSISAKNITNEGVTIKNIVVPFKHLRFIKK